MIAVLGFALQLVGPTTDSIDAYVRRQMDARGIPGVATAVIENGVVTTKRAYGIANLETETPVSDQSVFELASLTKQFTAACVMMLVREGKVRLDTTITAYIDGAPDGWKPITVRHLLNHTSGLPIDAIVGFAGSPLLNITTRQAFDFISRAPLRFPPGAAWSYSDAGYFLLGMIIERASGMSYREFMQRRVFDPLNMRESSILDRSRVLRHRVSVYTRRGGQLANWRRDWQYELPSFFGVFCTIGDLAAWDNAIRRGTLLPAAAWADIWTPARLSSGDDAWPQYGFGWNLGDMRGFRVAEHSGASGTFLLHVIDRPITVVVLTNLDVPSGPHASVIARGVAGIVDSALRSPRPAVPPADPDLAVTRRVDSLLTDLAAGRTSPTMTPSHQRFYASLPTPNRDGLARQLSRRGSLTFLAADDVRGRGLSATDTIARIAYYRTTTAHGPLYFTFYLTGDGTIAQMRLAPQ